MVVVKYAADGVGWRQWPCKYDGMYIKHADTDICYSFKSLCLVVKSESTSTEVTPRCGELRRKAHEQLSKAVSSMEKSVVKRVGKNKVCTVGEVVHVPLRIMDKAKVDTGNLTRVIVQVDKSRSQARVAVQSGLLKN